MRSHRWRLASALSAVVLSTAVVYAQQDREGCEDHPLVSRLDGFYIEGCKDQAFASYRFTTEKGKVAVEGHFTQVSYRRPRGAAEMSNLEMIRNYTNAIEAIGGDVTYEGKYAASMRVISSDRELWIEVAPSGRRSYRLTFVEKEQMTQQVVADAAALRADLDRTGHTVLHGILFDTDEAVVKPESETALKEIAKLLKDTPDMTAFIVGHTDMSGDLDHNLDLSRRRAAAVVEALTTHHGVPADRLAPRGIGPLAPVASNESDAGRALNRRVEMVER